ncbi:ABC-type transport system, permease [Haloferula helveola]|uniref:ABC-type transport system, permease n=1 Tax=Haloferula helveola TaxID=490095 RepID=A0ABM7RB92_9BACT|nr:ABC-type transport system, permease [Haloferula helveola]
MREFLNPPIETLKRASRRDLARTGLVTALGFALYGLTVGFWRSPVMGLYVAIKMPLLIACTLGCNGMLNGMLGLLLGSGLGFRQSLQALLGAFAISGLILGSVAPVTFFLALNAPPPDSPEASSAHAGYLLAHTSLIAVAGAIGVIRLGQLLREHCTSRHVAIATLLAWLGGNAFIGAQFSWIFRPFFGSPSLEVAFLRPNPMRGSFYEAVLASARKSYASLDPGAFAVTCMIAVVTGTLLLARIHHHRTRIQTS